MIEVICGIIEREGKYLIARRKGGEHFNGKWEFPGGKLESDETSEGCLRRELKEEFGIDSIVGDFFDESDYDYGHKKIKLMAYRVKHFSGKFVLDVHDKIEWVRPAELGNYDFCEADLPFVERLIHIGR